MTLLSKFLRASLLLAHVVFADASPGSSLINWQPCSEFNSTEPTQCANLTVPLDYTEIDSNKTLQLQLLRIPALHQPSKGSILFNFGGPGLAGRPSLASLSDIIRNSTSKYHDLVAFDPRGTGNTLPFSCFEDENERRSYFLQTPKAASFSWAKSSDTTLARMWATAKLLADKCYKRNRESGRLIGSAFVARDMMKIVDALGEDGLLRYWGGSYGTLLGQTAAVMFPERIDRMVLDGNVNPHEYYQSYDEEQWTDSDKTFNAVFQSCVADPSVCRLAQRYPNRTAAQLEETIYTLIDDLNDRPIPFNGTLIDYGFVKTGVTIALYSSLLWPILDVGFDALIARDLHSFTQAWEELVAAYTSAGASPDAVIGIQCGDKIVRVETLDAFLPIAERQFGISRILGDGQTAMGMVCAQWRLPAKGQYTGDFRSKTRHPILFIGNTADPITPLASAQNASAGFEGSVVLQANGYGHLSVGTSACVNLAVEAYYVNGTLPEAGTLCELDQPLSLGSVSGDVKGRDGLLPRWWAAIVVLTWLVWLIIDDFSC